MPLVDAEDCALIVIDVQEQFYGPERADIDRAALSQVVERVAWITGVAAALSIPIVVTEEDPQTNKHTFAQIVKHLPADAVILPKCAFAVADNRDILEAVKSCGVSTVILIGLETDICVAHSALRLQDSGWRVVAVEDALYSPHQGHDNGIRRMTAAGVDVLSAKELFYDWLPSVRATRSFNETHVGALPLPAGVVL